MTQKQIKRKLAASLTALVLAVSLIPARAAGAGYPDVPADEWYAQAVQDCQTYGQMDGTPEGTFQPSQLLTRAVVAEALYRLAGRPDSQGPQPFTDVPPNHINADAIRWAYQTCVVNGYPDGTFHPEDPIRREEIAVLLWSFRGRAPAQDAGYQDQGRPGCELGQRDGDHAGGRRPVPPPGSYHPGPGGRPSDQLRQDLL